MSLPEQLSRRFTNTQIEVREPLRRELDILTAEFLARGGNVSYLPNRFDEPRKVIPRPERKVPEPEPEPEPIPKAIEPQRFVRTSRGLRWDNKLENQRLVELRNQGLICREIAPILDREFASQRTEQAVRSALSRNAAGELGRPTKTPNYLPIENSWIEFLNEYGFTPEEISQALNQYIGYTYRSERAVQERSIRMGLTNNMKGRWG